MMQIREADSNDVGVLSRLNRFVQQMHVEVYPEFFKATENDDFAVSFFTSLLDAPDFHIFLAEEDIPVGYILLQVRRQPGNLFMHPMAYVQIDQIGVLPEYQGSGVGKALLSQAEQLAEQTGLNLVGLDSWSFNTQAHEFFYAQGFQNYILHMWKKISD